MNAPAGIHPPKRDAAPAELVEFVRALARAAVARDIAAARAKGVDGADRHLR